jgi:PDZ domain-containing secreted protein
MKSKWIALVAVALVAGLGVAPAGAQTEQEREELEKRLRELRTEMREVERNLMELRGSRTWSYVAPRVMAFSSNRARLGVTVQNRADEATDEMGAVLQSVVEDGPAGKAGLQAGDIVTSFNGEALTGRYPAAGRSESEPARKLIDLVSEMDEGDEVVLEYVRDGRSYTATATLEIVEPEWFGVGSPNANVRIMTRGLDFSGPGRGSVGIGQEGLITFSTGVWADIELVALNPNLGRYFGVDEGLLVVNAPEEISQLQAGDVIVAIGGRDADTPSRALRILRSYDEGEEIEMAIMRDQSRQTIKVVVPERHNEFFYERRY